MSNAPPSLPAQANPALDAIRLQVGLAFFAFVLIGANDAAIGVFLPSLRAFYGIDKSTVGFLFMASTTGYLLSAFVSGLLVERLGRRAYMLAGCVAIAMGALVIALTPPFPVVLLGASCLGFGVAVIDAGLNAYIAGMPNSTATLNYLHAFFGLGALLGPLLASGMLAAGIAWNVLYYLWVTVALVLLVGFAVAFKGHTPPPRSSHEGGNVLLTTLRLPLVWVAAVFLFAYVGIEVSLGSWAYTFLTEERHEAALISGWTVSGYWLGLTVGRLFMGKLSSRLGARQMIYLCLGGIVAGLLIVGFLSFGIASAAGLWLVGFSLGPIFPTTISLMSGFVPARLLASAVGFAVSVGAVGAAIFPAGAGVLADTLGLSSLLPYELALTVVLVACWFLLLRQSKASADPQAHVNLPATF
jgi:fucose permease